MAGRGGDGGNLCWSIIWFLILVFIGFWVGGFCAGWHILFQPFSVCIQGCAVSLLFLYLTGSFDLLIFIIFLFKLITANPRNLIEGFSFPEVLRREYGN